MGRRANRVDMVKLFRLWRDETLQLVEIARLLDVPKSTLSGVARRAGLQPRSSFVPHKDSTRVDPGEDDASCDSLRLAPTVAVAAAEVRATWSDEERYSRRVQKVQPVVVQSFSFGRYES